MKQEKFAWETEPKKAADTETHLRISANLWSENSGYGNLPNTEKHNMNSWLEKLNLLGRLSIGAESSSHAADSKSKAGRADSKGKQAIEKNNPELSLLLPVLRPLPWVPWANAPEKSKQEKIEQTILPPQTKATPEKEIVRSASQRSKFYLTQDDAVSCSAFAMGMMYSDHIVGRPLRYGKETDEMKELAGVGKHGYRGDLQSMADKLETLGLKAKAYQYAKVDKEVLVDLNAELALGHTAVAWVKNPMSGNGHYIYVAGRTADGDYILGDSGGTRGGYAKHLGPVSGEDLLKMMKGRYGFVAGWAAQEDTDAASIKGTAAYLRKHGRNRLIKG